MKITLLNHTILTYLTRSGKPGITVVSHDDMRNESIILFDNGFFKGYADNTPEEVKNVAEKLYNLIAVVTREGGEIE